MKELSDIQNILAQVEKKKIERAQLINSSRCLAFDGHQESVSVTVGSTKIDCTYLDRSTGYASRMKPGHDMLILAMKKMLNDKAWIIEQEIAALELKARALVNSLKV